MPSGGFVPVGWCAGLFPISGGVFEPFVLVEKTLINFWENAYFLGLEA